MEIRIALAGNPNSGKTTLFNALTGSNQFVGNWPGVTVEKKEGRLKGEKDVIITDLPGIYSLSPYTMEEVIARNVLTDQRPDALLNILDATNLERNLYLTTQLAELGIPMVVALNMMDVVRKNGDRIDAAKLSNHLGLPVIEISALRGDGVMEAAQRAVQMARSGKKTVPQHRFAGSIEHALAHIEEAALHNMPQEQQRWYAVKIFERDERVIEKLGLSKETLSHIEGDIAACEKEMDDDAESERDYAQIKEDVLGELKQAFKPEFLNRVDEIIVFHKLTKSNIKEIAVKMLESLGNRLRDNGITAEFTESAVEKISENGFDDNYGARPLRRAIQSDIEDMVAESMLEGKIKPGDAVTIDYKDDKFDCGKKVEV